MIVPDPQVNALHAPLARDSLYHTLDNFLSALSSRDPWRVKWSRNVRFTENNVALMLGDGVWNTASALGPYDLRFADPVNRQVGMFGLLDEGGDVCAFSVRLGIENDGLSQVEMLVVRSADETFKLPNPQFESKPVLNEILEPERRCPRERMIALADGYFDTLQLNDGAILTQFAPECQRVENGVQTTHNPNLPLIGVAHLGCEEQFRLGKYRFDDRVRGRRYPLVDEERGLVFSSVFIDHAGKLGEYRLTNGEVVSSPFRRPHTLHVLELFKISAGRIQQIEANHIRVPYHMPSPWDRHTWRNPGGGA